MREYLEILKENDAEEIDDVLISRVTDALMNDGFTTDEVAAIVSALQVHVKPRPQSRDYAKGYQDALGGKAFDPPTSGDRSEYERGWEFVRRNRHR